MLFFQVMVLFPILSNGQGVYFESMDWATLKAKAKASDKPIFVDTYAAWCEPCKWMNENVFSKEDVGLFFNENYLSYKIDVDGEDGEKFAKEYRITSYPTLLYFNSEGELVHRLVGAFKAEDLVQKSKDALRPSCQIYTLEKEFQNGKKELKFLKKYAQALIFVGEDYHKVTERYLEVVGQEALVEEEHFSFLEHYVNDYKHPVYRYVAANKADFVLALGVERVENYLDAAFNHKCYTIIENGSSKAVIKAFLQEVKQVLPDRLDYFKTRIDFYQKRGNERNSYRLAKKYEKHCKDAKSLNAIARYMLEVYDKNPIYLEKALDWAERAILLEESIYTLETKAMILLALGEKETALEVAQKQLVLSKAAKEHVEETLALIAKIKA